jgi:hypothetical protein
MVESQNFYFARATCPSGAGPLTGLFRSMQGVADVAVHYDDGMIEVTYDTDVTSVENISSAAMQEMGLRLTTTAPDGEPETC